LTVANVVRSHCSGRCLWLVLGVFLLGGLVPAVTTVAEAKLVRDKDAGSNAPRAVFGRIAQAWEAGDEQVLADLVHTDGLRVTSGPGAGRANNYSPSQAFYFFRNLFQSHRTLLFEFEMMQDATAGAQVHGMATWKRRRPDSEKIQDVKLVCILVQQGDQWKLAEINTIR